MPTRRQFIALLPPLVTACVSQAGAGKPSTHSAPSAQASATGAIPTSSAAAASANATTNSSNASAKPGCGWPAWEAFRHRFMQNDGRIIDFSADSHSTSEGQAYGLFFALVANDRAAFDLMLNWTRANLAQGDLTARLMAWHWGKKPDGSWGVLDENAASDADLWLAYTLYQAGAIWQDARLRAMAELLQARIERELIIKQPGVGPVLLPGPQGFALKSGGWKLNPSYLPPQVLTGLAHEATRGPWLGLLQSTLKMMDAVTPQGLVPDWIALRPQQGFVLDKEVGVLGGYDAIRCYLWAGMLHGKDPARSALLARMKGMLALLEKNQVPPQRVDCTTGAPVDGAGPLGISAALLPFLQALGATGALEQQKRRIAAGNNGTPGLPAIYYEQALGLFALGFLEQRFRFARDGKLVVATQVATQVAKQATC
jgi:endoglucanase